MLTLYRGDFQKIESFDINKTDKYCAVGRGIYLTNNLDVANTYRVKGSNHRMQDGSLWTGGAKDRTHAYELAYTEYVAAKLDIDTFRTKKQLADIKNAMGRFIDAYRNDISDGVVSAHYLSGNVDNLRYMEVKYIEPVSVGHLSVFNFDCQEFNQSMFMIDGAIRDQFFWELMWVNKINFGDWAECDTIGEYIDRNSNKHNWLYSPFQKTKSKNSMRSFLNAKETYEKIARVLKPYGYRGFEYSGGVRTGSSRHRAFAVWDDEWVNNHRVR